MMMRTKPQHAFSLVETLMALVLVGVIASLSIQAVKPENALDDEGRKTANYVSHLSSTYQRIYNKYGVTPLNVDFNEDGSADGSGVPDFIREFDSLAGYSNTSPEYLDYSSGVRAYIRPEQFGFMGGGVNTALTGAGITAKERILLDVDPNSLPTSLGNGDLVLLVVDDETGHVYSGNAFALEKGLSTGTFPPSFYDRYLAQ
jgi:prepilin-type N-terminal cleavage/methylation domain-containing protein